MSNDRDNNNDEDDHNNSNHNDDDDDKTINISDIETKTIRKTRRIQLQ